MLPCLMNWNTLSTERWGQWPQISTSKYGHSALRCSQCASASLTTAYLTEPHNHTAVWRSNLRSAVTLLNATAPQSAVGPGRLVSHLGVCPLAEWPGWRTWDELAECCDCWSGSCIPWSGPCWGRTALGSASSSPPWLNIRVFNSECLSHKQAHALFRRTSHVSHESSVLRLHQHVPDVVGVVGHGCRELLVDRVELVHLERQAQR